MAQEPSKRNQYRQISENLYIQNPKHEAFVFYNCFLTISAGFSKEKSEKYASILSEWKFDELPQRAVIDEFRAETPLRLEEKLRILKQKYDELKSEIESKKGNFIFYGTENELADKFLAKLREAYENHLAKEFASHFASYSDEEALTKRHTRLLDFVKSLEQFDTSKVMSAPLAQAFGQRTYKISDEAEKTKVERERTEQEKLKAEEAAKLAETKKQLELENQKREMERKQREEALIKLKNDFKEKLSAMSLKRTELEDVYREMREFESLGAVTSEKVAEIGKLMEERRRQKSLAVDQLGFDELSKEMNLLEKWEKTVSRCSEDCKKFREDNASKLLADIEGKIKTAQKELKLKEVETKKIETELEARKKYRKDAIEEGAESYPLLLDKAVREAKEAIEFVVTVAKTQIKEDTKTFWDRVPFVKNMESLKQAHKRRQEERLQNNVMIFSHSTKGTDPFWENLRKGGNGEEDRMVTIDTINEFYQGLYSVKMSDEQREDARKKLKYLKGIFHITNKNKAELGFYDEGTKELKEKLDKMEKESNALESTIETLEKKRDEIKGSQAETFFKPAPQD